MILGRYFMRDQFLLSVTFSFWTQHILLLLRRATGQYGVNDACISTRGVHPIISKNQWSIGALYRYRRT